MHKDFNIASLEICSASCLVGISLEPIPEDSGYEGHKVRNTLLQGTHTVLHSHSTDNLEVPISISFRQGEGNLNIQRVQGEHANSTYTGNQSPTLEVWGKALKLCALKLNVYLKKINRITSAFPFEQLSCSSKTFQLAIYFQEISKFENLLLLLNFYRSHNSYSFVQIPSISQESVRIKLLCSRRRREIITLFIYSINQLERH